MYYATFEAQAHNKPEGTMVRLICYRAGFSGELTPSMEIEKFDFFGYEQRAQTSVADNLLFDDLHKRGLIQ